MPIYLGTTAPIQQEAAYGISEQKEKQEVIPIINFLKIEPLSRRPTIDQTKPYGDQSTENNIHKFKLQLPQEFNARNGEVKDVSRKDSLPLEIAILRRLRSCNTDELFKKNASGKTPLHFAAEMGLKDAVIAILNRLSDDEKNEVLNAEDGNGDTPLMVAAKQKGYDMVSFLLSFQVPIRKVDLAYIQELLKDANGSASFMKGLLCDCDQIVADGFYLYEGSEKVKRIMDSDVARKAMLCVLPNRYNAEGDINFLHQHRGPLLRKIYERYAVILYRFDRLNPAANSVWKVAKLAERAFPNICAMTLHGHGESASIMIDSRGSTAADFEAGTFSPFKFVILDSCSTGREDERGNCLAKSLSSKPGSEGVKFYAASDKKKPYGFLFIKDSLLYYKSSAVVPDGNADIRDILNHASVCYENGQKRDVLRKTPLMLAITDASEDDALKLIESYDNSAFFEQDAIGMTALHYAIIKGRQKVVSEILRRLSDQEHVELFRLKNWRGDTLLDTAKEVGFKIDSYSLKEI